MGNSESSSVECGLSRCESTDRRREDSQSPSGMRRSGSCRRKGERGPGEPFRRSKTCRGKDRSASLFSSIQHQNARKAVCMTTGLSLHQKALLTRKWNRMDRGTVHQLSKQTFRNVFRETPHYLSYINLKDEENWENHINFKIHVQRFSTALVECMRRLREPSSACDILRDFGASYCCQPKRVAALYFERLANALNGAAAQLQEGDHLQIEKNESRLNYTEEEVEWENSESIDVSRGLPTTLSSPRLGELRRSLITRRSESQMDVLRRETAASRHDCANHPKSLCPITADAWIVLSAFLANQIKLGYELERMIKNEMSKLGLNSLDLVAPSSSLETPTISNKRPVHA